LTQWGATRDAGYVAEVFASGRPPVDPPHPPPPITSTPIQGTTLQQSLVTIPLDSAGNGYRQTSIPWAKFIAVTHQGSNPDPHADGHYWDGAAHAQNRNGNVLVSITGAHQQAGAQAIAFVAHA
jgi:hypothetical protein